MILLISSDAARRYSDDVFRALAHPKGTNFQFRYDVAHLDPKVRGLAQQNKLAAERALIAFLAADKTASTAVLNSVRAVTIAHVEIVGTSCILTVTAGDYLDPLDDAAIRSQLTTEELALLPAWTGGDHPAGSFAIHLSKADYSSQYAKLGKDMLAFEQTAIALSKFKPFGPATGMAFFAVRGIVSVDAPVNRWFAPDPAPKFADDQYLLQSGFRYRFEIYSYRPAGSAGDAPAAKLVVSTDEKAVQFTSTKEAVLDSRYDLKRFSLTTDQFLNPVPAAIRVALGVTSGPPPVVEQRCDITINTLFAGSRREAIVRTIVIAMGTASSAIIGVAFKDKFSLGVALLMCIGPLIAGATATFPFLRKSS